jgi:hypothetical protein
VGCVCLLRISAKHPTPSSHGPDEICSTRALLHVRDTVALRVGLSTHCCIEVFQAFKLQQTLSTQPSAHDPRSASYAHAVSRTGTLLCIACLPLYELARCKVQRAGAGLRMRTYTSRPQVPLRTAYPWVQFRTLRIFAHHIASTIMRAIPGVLWDRPPISILHALHVEHNPHSVHPTPRPYSESQNSLVRTVAAQRKERMPPPLPE